VLDGQVRAARMVGLDDAESLLGSDPVVLRGVDDDQPQAGGRQVGLAHPLRRLVEHDRAVDGLLCETLEGSRDVAVGAAAAASATVCSMRELPTDASVDTTRPRVCVRPVRSARAARCGR
jgi:hypothetical protein